MDDNILLMLQPRLSDISTRFAQEGKISTDDVHTLLLQSQYNHINHLDDEITLIRTEMVDIRQEFQDLRHEMKQEITRLDFKMEKMELGIRSDMAQLEVSIRSDMAQLGTSLRAEMNEGFANIGGQIERGLKENTHKTFAMIAVFIGVFQLIQLLL